MALYKLRSALDLIIYAWWFGAFQFTFVLQQQSCMSKTATYLGGSKVRTAHLETSFGVVPMYENDSTNQQLHITESTKSNASYWCIFFSCAGRCNS
mmetsp:Transcript_133477/g.231518  ORF Transcript_133477/g.231518 Transcript_133477/m.231518 type:complete len:96 (-) Transcript_133477:304-591(-)